MKYNILINQVKSAEWKLTTSEAMLFAWLYELPSWAEKMTYNGDVYFFANRSKACEEMPLVSEKKDTIYRLYKSLQNKNLISFITIKGNDFISITEKGKKWYRDSEQDSEKNPNDGNSSKKTEKNPIDNINNNKEKDNKKEIEDKSSISKENIDFDEIKAKWKEYNPNLEQPRMLNDKRKNAIRLLLKNNNATIDDLYTAFKLISISSFCQGRGKNNWKATFDWLINDTKGCFNRVLEGVYAYLPSEMEQVKKIKEGIDFSNGSNYTPIAGVDFFYNDFYKTWMYIGYDTSFIPDGYNADNRPDGAKVTLNNARGNLIWNAKDKKWEKE